MPAAPRSEVRPIASMILTWSPRPLVGGIESGRRRTRFSDASARAAGRSCRRGREGESTISPVGIAGLGAAATAFIFDWDAGGAAFILDCERGPGGLSAAAFIFGCD